MVKKKYTYKIRRACSFLIDLIVINTLSILVVEAIKAFIIGNYPGQEYLAMKIYRNTFEELSMPTTIILFWCYFLLCLYVYNGKTIGNILFNFRATNKYWRPISFKSAFYMTSYYFSGVMTNFLVFVLHALYPKKISNWTNTYFRSTLIQKDFILLERPKQISSTNQNYSTDKYAA